MSDPAATSLPDEEYRWMTRLLRGGLLLSLGLLLGALVAYAVAHPGLDLAAAVSTNPILRFLQVPGLLDGLAAGNPVAYLTVGLVVLVATPIARVASGFYYFRRGGERGMQAITLVVLALLLFGLVVLGPIIR